MDTDSTLLIVFFVLLSIAAMVSLFAVRMVGAIFSKKIRAQIVAHPVRHILWFIIFLGGVFIFGMQLLNCGGIQPRSLLMIQFSNLKQLGLAARIYAADHEGKFPDKLPDVFTIIPNERLHRFKDPKTNELHDWYYCPGYKDSDPANTILAFSPPVTYSNRPQRIVVFVDDSVSFMEEPKFMILLREQRQKKQQH